MRQHALESVPHPSRAMNLLRTLLFPYTYIVNRFKLIIPIILLGCFCMGHGTGPLKRQVYPKYVQMDKRPLKN